MFLRKLVFLLLIGLLAAACFGCAKKATCPPVPGAAAAEAPAAPGGAMAAPEAPRAAPGEGVTEEGVPGEEAAPGAALGPEAARRAFSEDKVYFEFDSYTLSPEAERTLDAKAAYLRENPRARVLIEGHADERGTDEYNLALGERRAMAAKSYLCAAGIDSGRINTISYGEERPVDPAQNEEAWAKNRRDEFVLR